jgi:RNA polymerase sigma-70 factor (ECF subfamily)
LKLREGPALDLVSRAQAGHREAFDMLVERHAYEIYRLAAAIVGPVDARDVTQETFVIAWQRLPSLRKPDAFGAWARRICANRSKNWLRGRIARGPQVSLDSDDELSASLPDRRADFRSAVDASATLAPAYEALTDDQRTVLALHYGLGYSIAETADALGIRSGTAKSRLNAALAVMRQAVLADPETSPEVTM